jgi:hypothetical protein
LEKLNKPTVTICTDRFRVVAETLCKSLGIPGLSVVYVPHPLGGHKAAEVQAKADAVLEQIIQALTGK